MSIFDFDSYKDFFNSWVKLQPNRGRGLLSQLAKTLQVNTTLMSLIFKGSSHLTQEQAIVTAQFMNLLPLQSDYFIQLVNLERTARPQARQYIQQKLFEIKQQAENLQSRLNAKSELEASDYAQFFSHWIYTALFLQVAIHEKIERAQLSTVFNCDKSLVHEAIEFLVQTSVLSETNGLLSMGVTQIYIGQQSQFLRNHLSNWRQRAGEVIQNNNLKENIFYSCPIVLSHTDAQLIAEKIRTLIEDFNKIAGPSKSEKLMCLNVDWFSF